LTAGVSADGPKQLDIGSNARGERSSRSRS
jgi:hypothetical protein